MPDIHTIWVGGAPPQWAREGLVRLGAQFPRTNPEEQRNFWVLPKESAPGEAADAAMQGMRDAADAAGFTVRNISEHLDEFAQGMPTYSRGMLDDIIKWEMAHGGEISVKDLTNFMVLGHQGGLSMDLSMHAITDNSIADVGTIQSLDGAEFKVPQLAPSGISRHIGSPSYSPYTRNPDNEAEPHTLPHLDVWAMYARPGGKGQDVMRAAAEKMVGNYASLANDGIKDQKIVRRAAEDGAFDPTRLSIVSVERETELGAKWTPGDGHRPTVIGHFAMSALYDSINGVYGEQVEVTHASEISRFEVAPSTWPDITWRTVTMDDQRIALPELGISKELRNSWRQPNGAAPTPAMAASLRLVEPTTPGYARPTPATHGASTAVSPAVAPPQSRNAGTSSTL